jgi:benzoyl-CoA reductase/2-hydroxyglutaryl-CoA dehydratase subunit BcrC/BadD/HgdB
LHYARRDGSTVILSTQNKEIYLYEQEIKDTLKRLDEHTHPFLDTEYFTRTARDYFNLKKMSEKSPKVIILGTNIPEEIIYAFGATPYWILGGSLGTTAWADELVPRDTDAVSRSIFGFLVNDICELAKDALIIIPIVSDSSKKLAYLLKRAGKKIHTVDVPPVKDSFAADKWRRQIERCVDALSAHTRKRITHRTLQKAMLTVADAKKQMRRFIGQGHLRYELLPGSFRMFILNSYYYASNIEEWTANLNLLNDEIGSVESAVSDKGNVLLFGSPVYFPNYKIPFLIQDVGLNISMNVDYTTQKILYTEAHHKPNIIDFAELGHDFFQKDGSSAYTKNDTLYNSVYGLIQELPIEGVVYHVLKGQIEYDYELNRFEELFTRYNIPVFRLETDYKYQDVEQLRIRMEAFTEMLQHRRQYRQDGCLV